MKNDDCWYPVIEAKPNRKFATLLAIGFLLAGIATGFMIGIQIGANNGANYYRSFIHTSLPF